MEINAISFNIRCCDDDNGNAISERAPRLNEIVSKYDADLIGIQEFTVPWEKHIDKYFGDEYEIFYKYRAKDSFEATPILWKKDKFECVKKGYFWLSDTPEVESKGWDELCKCHRICVYAILKCKKTGEKFVFMNTHFGFGDNGQVASAKLIYDYSKKISDYPTFVTGDFNMNPKSAGYKEMTRWFTDVNAVTANDLRDTWHDYDIEHPKGDQHIDYCFIDDRIKPVNQKIIDETVDGKFPSDHFGLHIALEI